MTENQSGEQGECKAVLDCMCISRMAWTHKDFRFWLGCIVSPRTDWVQTEFNGKLNSTVSLRQSRDSQSDQGWPGSQKELKTKLGTTVSTKLGLGTLGNLFSDLVMQKSYGIMLRHQNQNKTPISRNPFCYWYPSETDCLMLWPVNCLGSWKTTLAE
jgi:hypothetical protein